MALNPEWYDANVAIAAMWGPCTYPSKTYLDPTYTKENMRFLEENNIWAFSGPNWSEQRELIVNSGIQGLIDGLGLMDGLQNNPVSAVSSYSQKAHAERF